MIRPITIVVVLGALVHADPITAVYAHDARVAYLARALDAVRGLGAGGRDQLEQVLYQGARERCRAALGLPSIACTVELAHATCAARADRASCDLAADVVLTNQRSETEFVDEGTRMRLVGTATDYHVALLAELTSHHAALAADLALAEPAALTPATLPARIDRFCAGRELDPSYQRCAAALIWYIGSREAP